MTPYEVDQIAAKKATKLVHKMGFNPAIVDFCVATGLLIAYFGDDKAQADKFASTFANHTTVQTDFDIDEGHLVIVHVEI